MGPPSSEQVVEVARQGHASPVRIPEGAPGKDDGPPEKKRRRTDAKAKAAIDSARTQQKSRGKATPKAKASALALQEDALALIQCPLEEAIPEEPAILSAFELGKVDGKELPKDDDRPLTRQQSYVAKRKLLGEGNETIIEAHDAAKKQGQTSYRMWVNSMVPRNVGYGSALGPSRTSTTAQETFTHRQRATAKVTIFRVGITQALGLAGGFENLQMGIQKGDVIQTGNLYKFKSYTVQKEDAAVAQHTTSSSCEISGEAKADLDRALKDDSGAWTSARRLEMDSQQVSHEVVQHLSHTSECLAMKMIRLRKSVKEAHKVCAEVPKEVQVGVIKLADEIHAQVNSMEMIIGVAAPTVRDVLVSLRAAQALAIRMEEVSRKVAMFIRAAKKSKASNAKCAAILDIPGAVVGL